MLTRILVWLTFTVIMSCAVKDNPSEVKQQQDTNRYTRYKYPVYRDARKNILINKIFNSAWLIGLHIDPNCSEERQKAESIKKTVREGLKKWIEPIAHEVKKNGYPPLWYTMYGTAPSGIDPPSNGELVSEFDIVLLENIPSTPNSNPVVVYDFIVYIDCSGSLGYTSYKKADTAANSPVSHLNLAVHIGQNSAPTRNGMELLSDHEAIDYHRNIDKHWITKHVNKSIILHELGHLFGMSDIKVIGGGRGRGEAKGVSSVMNWRNTPSNNSISNQDRKNIIEIYKRAFDNDPNNDPRI